GEALVGDGVVLPARHPEDEVSNGVAVAVGAHHLTDAAAADDLADPDGRQVPLSVVHPGADRGVDREVLDPNQGLVGAGLGYWLLFEAGGGVVDHARGALGEDEAAVA